MTDSLTKETKSGSPRQEAIMTSRKDLANMILLLLTTGLISSIISGYVLYLSYSNSKNISSDPLKRAALSAADDLLKITVFSRDFGTLGIADYVNLYGGDGESAEVYEPQVRSFNTVASLIRASLFMARDYHLQTMGQLGARDMTELQSMKDELRKKLQQAIKADGTGKIYEHVKRILTTNSRSGEHLVRLNIKLGAVKRGLEVSAVPAQPGDPPAAVLGGKLQTLIPLSVPFYAKQIVLHQQSKKAQFFPADDFVEETALPNVILIDAWFTGKGGKKEESVSRVCVAAGADLNYNEYGGRPVEGCLSVSFPHGKPDTFNSLESILVYKDWQGKGDWQQAIQGPVPGSGQLAPQTTPPIADMNGSEALSLSIYHWLRQLAQPVDAVQLTALLKRTWVIPPPARNENAEAPKREIDINESIGNDETNEYSRQVNSGLLKNSDARTFALLNQSKPAEVAQKALLHCFQARTPKFPASTLPLIVDAHGMPSLPGRQGLDQKLAFDLLSGIYNTNLAAQDTLASAKLIHASAVRNYRSSKERLFLAETDLDSLNTRLKSESNEKEIDAIKKEMDWRNNRITYEINEQKKQLKAVSLAQQAIANATAVAGQSYECGSKLFQLTGSGIYRLDNFIASSETGGGIKSGFLLSKRYIFLPMTESLDEKDIIDEAAKAFESSPSDGSDKMQMRQPSPAPSLAPPKSPWLARKVTIFAPVNKLIDTPETQFIVEGRTLAELKSESPPVLKAPPATVVFTPRLLTPGAAETPLYFHDYPFKGLPISESQMFYYSQNAFRAKVGSSATKAGATAAKAGATAVGAGVAAAPAETISPVSWSVLARDLVVFHGLNSSHQRLGLPLTPSSTGWCKRALNANSQPRGNSSEPADSCPGLAAEWQLRAPLMLLNESESRALKGSTLSDPTSGQRVLQIPPVGPDLI